MSGRQKRTTSRSLPKPTLLGSGRFLRLLRKGQWEYTERFHCKGAVYVVAVTDQGKLLITEQLRPSLNRQVIELPAGLVGDEPAHQYETLEKAVRRELLEETGYVARRVLPLTSGPTSSGLSNEIVWMMLAVGLKKRGRGGGLGTESIRVHEVPVEKVEPWLRRIQRKGRLVDSKIYAALYFLQNPARTHRPSRFSRDA